MSGPLEGLLLVDKPEGPTSHDVVARIRKLLGTTRVGHTGTLDPHATGLLIILVGGATRLARFVPREPKSYTGTVRLGIRTSSDDLQGEPTFQFTGPPPNSDSVRAAARQLTGRRLQAPPAVSARKIGGVRMYRLSRLGRPVVGTPTEVQVDRFDVQPTSDPFEWSFIAEVSAGTYVRSMARDWGEALGCGGAIATLRRTAIGPFGIDAATSLQPDEGLANALNEALIPLHQIPFFLPVTRLEDESARRFLFGGSVAVPGPLPPEGDCMVFGPTGRLLGVGAASFGRLRPSVVLPGRSEA